MASMSPESTLRARMVSTSREPQRSTLRMGLRRKKSLKVRKSTQKA
jgi:hypothetical protein